MIRSVDRKLILIIIHWDQVPNMEIRLTKGRVTSLPVRSTDTWLLLLLRTCKAATPPESITPLRNERVLSHGAYLEKSSKRRNRPTQALKEVAARRILVRGKASTELGNNAQVDTLRPRSLHCVKSSSMLMALRSNDKSSTLSRWES